MTQDDPELPLRLLPIPAPSMNNSQSSFIVTTDNEWRSLPPEVASADISIAPDGSFVETSSGPAARELKRRYDQHLGVGKDVRSPYAITAFINQHGKQMYRVNRRDAVAPAAAAEEAEHKASISNGTSRSRASKTRSRLSVHNFLSQSKPKPHDTHATQPRKLLRRTRSIPDMFGIAASSSATGSPNQPTPTGRTHSHSVTGADMPRPLQTTLLSDPKPPTTDIFSDVMHWPNNPSGSSTPESETRPLPGFIPYPFGLGTTFESPTRPSTNDFLPMPRALREMQSFESGLTARAGDIIRRSDTPDSILPLSVSPDLHPSSPPIITPDPELTPLPETSMHSRYSTEVFDVLQTYRGLPQLDRLFSDAAGETTIKMSLRAEDSAAPRNDPRFVLWGEMQQAPSDLDGDDLSSRGGMSSPSTTNPRRGHDGPAPRDDGDGTTAKVLIAATIERWIAQLTSELDYDELLNFFLTYRTYISAVDLCHLLICRFHWALSGRDDMVRKIVRVRTFVAVRYWLLTFFVMDFLPNRELRLLLASWLNTLVKDPILKKHQDGLSIVRKLIKVAKDCKEAHTRRRRSGSVSARQSISTPLKPRPTHVLGEKFAEAISSKHQDDSDVDLDFVPDEGPPQQQSIFHGDSSNAFSFNSGVSSPPRPGAGAAVTAILQQPSQMNILHQSRASISAAAAATSSSATTTTVDGLSSGSTSPNIASPHSALSRAFVKTIGRLGRWKRVLNSRQTVDTGLAVPANVSAFDLELNAAGDLLRVRGGVEQYLKMIDLPELSCEEKGVLGMDGVRGCQNQNHATVDIPQTQLLAVTEVAEEEEEVRESVDTVSTEKHASIAPAAASTHSRRASVASSIISERMSKRLSISSTSRMSTRTHSTDSFGSILSSRSRINPFVAQVQAQPPWRFDVVSIDDLDLSDTSSEAHGDTHSPPVPPGLRKPPRRLPLRRDFEFVRRSVESVSSMGIRSRDSVASSAGSVVSAVSLGGAAALGNGIHQWQVNALVDSLSDDDDDGGVEEALRRLEGQINPQKRREKAQKVDGWVRTIQERIAVGDFGDEQPRFFGQDSEDEGGDGYEDYEIDQHDTGASTEGEPTLVHTASQTTIGASTEDYLGSVPSEEGTDVTFVAKMSDSKPAPEDAVPLEILQSRVPSRPSTSQGSPPAPTQNPFIIASPSKFISSARKPHRCWVLGVNTDTLVQHFSMIDRELFLGLKPEELIMDDWMSCREVDVLDWAQYLKDRARWKAESRWSQKTSALAAVRGRFNLIANFVVSEIVLTHPNDRAVLVGKFIRVALKAYVRSNFNTLAAIIAGLRNEWVNKAMQRHWSRVRLWENGIFQKLKQFTSPDDDFKAMRDAITAMVDSKPLNVTTHTSTIMSNSSTDLPSGKSRGTNDTKTKTPSVCIPFIGVYLSQLYRYNGLPDLIDPTSPHEPVGIDAQTVNFESPAHPEVFDSLTPLPPSMQLEPLINVHKQRLIAGVIKDLVAGQHLASRVQYPIDKKLFQKCLRLRGLSGETLQRAYTMYVEPETRHTMYMPSL